MSKRTKTNFYINLALFIVFAALIGGGILIKFVLVPGQERWLLYGQNMELTFLGLDRHEWGTIHLIIGIVFFILLVFHIIFHWNVIKCLFRRYIKKPSVRSFSVALAFLLFIGLIVFPFFIQPEKSAITRGEGRINLEGVSVDLNDSIRVKLKKPKKLKGDGELELDIQKKKNGGEREDSEDKKYKKQEIDITGSMTLNDVVEKYDCPLSKLKDELDLPDFIDGSERLGHLRKQYGFRLGDVKEIIIKKR